MRFLPLLLVAGCTPHVEQAPACAAAIACYFNNADADHDLKRVAAFDGLGDTDLFLRTYGVTGSCWASDVALAHACEDRCRFLLAQDCAQPYVVTDGGLPFCKDTTASGALVACSFPDACEVTRVQGDGGVLADITQCPQPDGFCTAAADQTQVGVATFGCCTGDSEAPLVDGGCAYTYP